MATFLVATMALAGMNCMQGGATTFAAIAAIGRSLFFHTSAVHPADKRPAGYYLTTGMQAAPKLPSLATKVDNLAASVIPEHNKQASATTSSSQSLAAPPELQKTPVKKAFICGLSTGLAFPWVD